MSASLMPDLYFQYQINFKHSHFRLKACHRNLYLYIQVLKYISVHSYLLLQTELRAVYSYVKSEFPIIISDKTANETINRTMTTFWQSWKLYEQLHLIFASDSQFAKTRTQIPETTFIAHTWFHLIPAHFPKIGINSLFKNVVLSVNAIHIRCPIVDYHIIPPRYNNIIFILRIRIITTHVQRDIHLKNFIWPRKQIKTFAATEMSLVMVNNIIKYILLLSLYYR